MLRRSRHFSGVPVRIRAMRRACPALVSGLPADVSVAATSGGPIWHVSCSPYEAGTDSHKEQRHEYPFPRRHEAGPRRRRRPLGHRTRAPLCGAQLRSPARRARARRRLLAVGRARPPLPRHDERLFGGEPRPRASAHRVRAGRAGAAARRDVARLPQRAPACVAAKAGRSHGTRPRPARERRRRSGRDRAQGRAQMGTQDQGHPGRSCRDHRLRRQFPWPVDHDRRLFVRAAIPRRLRTVRAGLPRGSLRRCRCARPRHRPRHRRVSRRADPG